MVKMLVFHLLFQYSSCYNKISEDSPLVELELWVCVILGEYICMMRIVCMSESMNYNYIAITNQML